MTGKVVGYEVVTTWQRSCLVFEAEGKMTFELAPSERSDMGVLLEARAPGLSWSESKARGSGDEVGLAQQASAFGMGQVCSRRL